jgi:cyanophycinase-like exopeptidase
MNARLLTIMGSGETAPTMIKTHRRLIEAVGPHAVMLDTPYGFQENAADISSKAQEYFRDSVGAPIEVANWRSAHDDTLTRETALGRIGAADYVFAGPGSPTYALRQWEGTPLASLLAEKLERGGGVTFASAAALTLGACTVPVYEIYKVGAVPAWAPGLDLLAAIGLKVAVIPHYDNAEGGGHDTRFCYLGERRLAMLEPELPDDAFVLGVDEHTGLVIDLDSSRCEVVGNGVVTVRRRGVSTTFPAGTEIGLDQLVAAGADPGGATSTSAMPTQVEPTEASPTDAPDAPSLAGDAHRLEAAFKASLDRRDVDGAVAAVLELDTSIVEWSRDTLQSDEADLARATLRRMIVRLGAVAVDGARDPRDIVAPFVETALAARTAAREAKQFELADQIRDDVVAAGIEIQDQPEGTFWKLLDTD